MPTRVGPLVEVERKLQFPSPAAFSDSLFRKIRNPLNVSVAGSTTWTATVNFVAPAVDFSTWNVNATFPSRFVMVVKPNGNGNNWGMTVTPNGQFTWPSVSCNTG
jgi:hypothetical protein